MKDIDENFGYLINKSSKIMRYKFNEKLKAYELTAAQWAVLKDIHNQEGMTGETKDTSPASIAERLYTDRPTLSGMLERLLIKGWVVSAANPRDRRSQLISLTDKAKGVITDLEKLGDEVADKALNGFSASEIQMLKGFLKRLINNLS